MLPNGTVTEVTNASNPDLFFGLRVRKIVYACCRHFLTAISTYQGGFNNFVSPCALYCSQLDSKLFISRALSQSLPSPPTLRDKSGVDLSLTLATSTMNWRMQRPISSRTTRIRKQRSSWSLTHWPAWYVQLLKFINLDLPQFVC